MSEPPSIGLCAQAACILDVDAFKPGNVNLWYGFADMTAVDFLFSAAAIAPVLDQAPLRRIGDTILECIRETRRVTVTNTNLGIVLLLAPLASVQPGLDLRGGVIRALMRLDVTDALAAYAAIRLAQPGGLGTVPEQDVSREPTIGLRDAMALAADRDLIARQYVNDFEQVFEAVDILRAEVSAGAEHLGQSITHLYLRLLAKYPDSLIARKHGKVFAEEVSRKAGEVLRREGGHGLSSQRQFEQWLFGTGPSGFRNPGTTADLVVASLFVALRQNIIQLPLPKPG
jgi:triphosphoribosyl-dephospho-CoA synthase